MRHHALLIGIDAYPGPNPGPLGGCVHDVDDVQGLLLASLAAPQITRLVAPLDAASPATPPTRANILAALEGLAEVGPEDRVLIYYSGHGARVEVRAGRRVSPREALVPLDASEGADGALRGLIFDSELGARLAAIASRTQQVSVILDCCHSGGVARSGRRARGVARWAEFRGTFTAEALGLPEDLSAAPRGLARALAGSLEACAVACACLPNERAQEGVQPDGRRGGYFTRALLRAIAGASAAPAELRWGSIWHALVADLTRWQQHPQLLASFARKVLGGPPETGDSGIPLRIRGARFELDAGELAGVTKGTRVAAYGADPPILAPETGSPEDLAARLGELEVSEAGDSRASAEPVAGADPQRLARGVRARILRPGRPLLTLAIDPPDAALAAALAGAGFVRIVAGDAGPAATLRRTSAGWLLGDDLHGDDGDDAAPPLVRAPGDATPAALVRLLRHYCRYIAPVELARRCQGAAAAALTLEVLDCSGEARDASGRIARAGFDPQAPDLAPIPAGTDGLTRLVAGRSAYCLRVNNLGARLLHATIVACAADGSVRLLGAAVALPGMSQHVVWRGGDLGAPFVVRAPEGRSVWVTRVVAIATGAAGRPLHFLATAGTFAAALDPPRAPTAKRAADEDRAPAQETWAAAWVDLRASA